jgi:hypothetical protein
MIAKCDNDNNDNKGRPVCGEHAFKWPRDSYSRAAIFSLSRRFSQTLPATHMLISVV